MFDVLVPNFKEILSALLHELEGSLKFFDGNHLKKRRRERDMRHLTN